MKITREMLIEEGCCYAETPGKLEQYVPHEGLTPLQVCDADVSVYDKLWALLRKYGDYQPLTDRQYRLLACKWARDACELAGWDDVRSLRAIDVAERYADGLATEGQLEASLGAAARAAREAWKSWSARESWESWSARSMAASAASSAAVVAALEAAAWEAAWEAALEAAWEAALAVAERVLDAACDAAAAEVTARAEAHSRHIADIRAVLTCDLFAEVTK